jgi:tetratricopeptide (TPR) repeat protein
LKFLLIILLCISSVQLFAKEFTQEEADRYNYLFKTANELINPYLRLHDVKHSKADEKTLRKVIVMYDEAILINPESWSSMWLKGKAYQALNETQLAYSSFKKSYNIKPDNPDVVNEYLMETTNLNHIEEALDINRKAVTQFPNHLGLQANYSLILILAGKIDQAIEQGNLALKMKPNDKITMKLIEIAQNIKLGTKAQPKTIHELTAEM